MVMVVAVVCCVCLCVVYSVVLGSGLLDVLAKIGIRLTEGLRSKICVVCRERRPIVQQPVLNALH